MKTREEYLDVLRGLAAVSVVFYHCGADSSSGILSYQLIELLLNWCVPIFLMITGALFLCEEKQLSITEMCKRVIHLLKVIVVWGGIYNLFSLLLIQGPSLKIIPQSIIMTVCADTTYAYQLWYLYLLVGLYLIIPVIKPWMDTVLVKEKPDVETTVYFIFILFVSIIIPNGMKLAHDTGSFWQGAFSVYSGFGFYLLCGAWIRRWGLQKNHRFILLLSVVGIGSFFAYNFIHDSFGNNSGWYGYTTYFTWAISVLLFDMFKRINFDNWNIKIRLFFYLLSKYSLGIYILHPMVLQVLRKVGLRYENMNPWIFPLIIVPITVSICVVVSKVIKRQKWINNLI